MSRAKKKPSRLTRTSTSALAVAGAERYAIDVERARDLLASCKTLDQARGVSDKAQAAQAYLRAIGASLDAQNDAAEVRLRAERWMGAFLAEVVKNQGAKGSKVTGNRRVPVKSTEPTLEERGLTKAQSSRWQALARVPEATFVAHVTSVRERASKLTTSGAIAAASHAEGYDGDESYTPLEYIVAARGVMGGIELDPATSALAQKRVQADRFYTKRTGGLTKSWAASTLWVNPPYSTPLIQDFSTKLVQSLREIGQAIALVNAATDTSWFHELANASAQACLVAGRINFDQVGPDGELRGTKGNRFAQAFLYFGPHPDAFRSRFCAIGLVGRLEGA